VEWRAEPERDWNALVRAVLLLALTAFLARLIITGQIRDYIHPKFTWFTASAGIGLLLMAGGQLARGLRGSEASGVPLRSRLYLAVALVLCMGFAVKPHTFGADLAQKQGINLTNRSATGGAKAPAQPNQAAAVAPVQTTPAAPAAPSATETTPSPTSPSAGAVDDPAKVITMEPPASTTPAPAPKKSVVLTGSTAIVTQENFVPWMEAFYGKPALYAGKRVVMEGFTFYPPQASDHEFAVTRLVVTCHVAHAYPDGLLVVMDGKARPAQDTWHRVEGRLKLMKFQGQDTLVIKPEKVTSISAPSDPYVYP